MSSHAPVPIDQLLAHREWVRRVARALVQDENDADDLEQGLWLDALQHPPRTERSLRGWLFTALRRDRDNARLSAASRAGREHATARAEAVPSAEELVAKADALKRVVVAVMDLAEPHRSTILYRYFEELPVSAIAERQGVPVETVRTRLKRALAQLRERFDAEHDGSREKWCVALLPLLRPSLDTSTARAPTQVTASAAASVLGGVLMAKKVVVACVILVLLLVGGWLAAGRFASTKGPTAEHKAVESSSALAPPAHIRARVTDASESPAPPAAVTPAVREAFPPPSPSGSLVVRVLWENDGSPAAGLWVTVHPWDGPDPFLYVLRERTTEDGLALFPAVHVGRAGIYVETGGAPVATIEADSRREVVVRVPKGHAIEGAVVDAKSAPVADAAVYAKGFEVARTGADGSFVFRIGPNGAQVGARAAGHAPSGRYLVMGAEGATTHLRIVLPDGGGSIAGRILDPDGHPLAHARVRAGPWNTARCLTLDDGSARPVQDAFETTTDAEGRYRIDGLESGKTTVRVRAPRFAPAGADVDVPVGKTAELDVVLAPGGCVVGTVKDAGGVAVRDATVLAGPYGDFLSAQCRTDAEGRFRLDGLTPCDAYPVSVEAEGKGKASASIVVRRGAEAAWDPVLSGANVFTGRVLDGSGRPRSKWLVHVSPMQFGMSWQDSAVTDADGRFVVSNCPDDLLRVEVTAAAVDGAWPKYPSAVRTDVRPAATALDITVDDRDLPTAFLVGAVLDADGRPAEGVEIRVRHSDQRMTPYQFAEAGTGRFRVGPLPPATYEVTIVANGHPDVRVGKKDVRPNAELDLGTIQLVAGGLLEVRAKRDGGAAATRIWGEVFAADGTNAGFLAGDGDVARCPSLPPGRYTVRVNETVSATESWMALLAVEVRAGGKTSVDAMLAAAGLRTFRATLVAGGAPTGNVRVVVRTVAGAPVYDMTTPLTANRAVSLAFPVGSYVAEASTADGLRGDARFEIASAGTSKEVVTLILR
jgi:RNA polymerase sigma-70 factor (ECF subfamily)